MIVVDNGSTDDTPAVIARQRASFPGRHCATSTNHARQVARGRAARCAWRGDILAFTDDDVNVDAGVARDHLARDGRPDTRTRRRTGRAALGARRRWLAARPRHRRLGAARTARLRRRTPGPRPPHPARRQHGRAAPRVGTSAASRPISASCGARSRARTTSSASACRPPASARSYCPNARVRALGAGRTDARRATTCRGSSGPASRNAHARRAPSAARPPAARRARCISSARRDGRSRRSGGCVRWHGPAPRSTAPSTSRSPPATPRDAGASVCSPGLAAGGGSERLLDLGADLHVQPRAAAARDARGACRR